MQVCGYIFIQGRQNWRAGGYLPLPPQILVDPFPHSNREGTLCPPHFYLLPPPHCVFKWILRGHLKPPPSATI
jgi:hypothetical protein